MRSGCIDAERLQGCRVAAGMQDGYRDRGGCRLAEQLQGCRRVAGMPSGCIDAGWMQDGVIAQMGVVAGLQGGCIDTGWLQGCRMG